MDSLRRADEMSRPPITKLLYTPLRVRVTSWGYKEWSREVTVQAGVGCEVECRAGEERRGRVWCSDARGFGGRALVEERAPAWAFSPCAREKYQHLMQSLDKRTVFDQRSVHVDRT